ncbi:GNAT family N-acetyltransferase [Urechidicola vernalis]|uniref:GNAT family N-acetyltransferase n=1 Tax=Urechidicola vernalis TaxID=3075600 RepID=A0ABU2Y0S7_9FLAO|nr:N-acetyltransferase family protein [Urechidicola sp. P050]MDT0551779.1 GNAT family N-acetyltransferase [Urechidicola sp. P050]
MIRKVQLKDAKQIVAIYNYFVLNSIVTFDKTPFSESDFVTRIKNIQKKYPFIVFEENGAILGYAYANKWREKPAYKQTIESTVYVKHNIHNKGIGSKLYKELLNNLRENNYHTVVGGLSLPNDASIKLHENFGFKKVAHFKEVGFKFGDWVDVGFWQLKL